MADAVEKVLPATIGVSKAQHDTSSEQSIVKAAWRPTNLTKATKLDNVRTQKKFARILGFPFTQINLCPSGVILEMVARIHPELPQDMPW